MKRHFKPKKCVVRGCRKVFTPNGNCQKYCKRCVKTQYARLHREGRLRRLQNPEYVQKLKDRTHSKPFLKQARKWGLTFRLKKMGLSTHEWLEEKKSGCVLSSLGCCKGKLVPHHSHETDLYVCCLCFKHNIALGSFGDDARVLIKAGKILLKETK
jgi:hypothetical protein